jgi:hypothetical protein
MTREDIIRMAREAGFELNMWQLSVGCEATGTHEELEHFAALVAAAEREACAKACDDRAFQFFSESPFFVEMHGLANSIRARSKA